MMDCQLVMGHCVSGAANVLAGGDRGPEPQPARVAVNGARWRAGVGVAQIVGKGWGMIGR